MQNFLDSIKSNLHIRYKGLSTIFNYLNTLPDPIHIIETGCCRRINDYVDGGSTLLFDRFLQSHSGSLLSIDITPDHCKIAQSQVSNKTTIICHDSVSYLHSLKSPKINLLYLDSYDIDWNNPHPASLHHIKELLAALPLLQSNTLIVVDDNTPTSGKGSYIQNFMDNIKATNILSDYQLAWLWP